MSYDPSGEDDRDEAPDAWLKAIARCPDRSVPFESTRDPARGAEPGLQRYRLGRRLGQGGMATVWEAEHVLTHRKVAIKIVRPRVGESDDGHRRVLREAKASSAVRHPAAVPVLDVVPTADGGYGLVMDRLVGATLREHLDTHGPLDARETGRLLLPAAEAVAAAHRAGVLHRDLKPQNLFVERNSEASAETTRVLDFGIATALRATASWTEGGTLTETGVTLGTPAYMAPEQLLGERRLSAATDVWAFGVIVYECLAGQRPITGSNVAEVLQSLSHRSIVPLSRLAPDVPAPLSDLVMSMLEPRLERRLDSMDTVSRVLRYYAQGAVGAVPSDTREPTSRARQLAAYTALCAATALLVWPRDLSERPTPRYAAAAVIGVASQDAGASRLPLEDAQAPLDLSFATLTPKRSPWTRLFDVWRRAVAQRTEGRIQIRIQDSGGHFFHGSEASLLSRLRTGQLDGAALSGLSLAKIHPSVLALQVPGLLDTWGKLDAARAALRPDLDAALREEAFEVVAWGDVGQVKLLSRGGAIRRPADLQHRRAAVMESDPLAPVLFSLIPAAIPVPLGVADVLPALRRHSAGTSVTALAAPSWMVEQHQWTASLDHVTEQPLACAVGAVVLKADKLDSVLPDDRHALLDLARRIEPELSARVRKLDADAQAQLRRKLIPVVPTDAERAEWDALLQRAASRFSRGIVPESLLERARAAAGEADIASR